MEGLPLEGLGVAGAIGALALVLILWKLFKLALKVVVLVVVAAVIAGVVAIYLQSSHPALPVPRPTGTEKPGIPAPGVPR